MGWLDMLAAMADPAGWQIVAVMACAIVALAVVAACVYLGMAD